MIVTGFAHTACFQTQAFSHYTMVLIIGGIYAFVLIFWNYWSTWLKDFGIPILVPVTQFEKCTENYRGVWSRSFTLDLLNPNSCTYLRALPIVPIGICCLNPPNDEISLLPFSFLPFSCSFVDPWLMVQDWEACDALSPLKHKPHYSHMAPT